MLKALTGQAQTETVPWVARDILQKMGLVAPIGLRRHINQGLIVLLIPADKATTAPR